MKENFLEDYLKFQQTAMLKEFAGLSEDDLKQININLTEKYEELENKYKTMERNFYDAFS